MLFNSYTFVLGFLPVVLLLTWSAGRRSTRAAAMVLVAASLFFYGWWNPRYLALIGASIAVNYALGRALQLRQRRRRAWLALGVAFNLLLLGGFKYADMAIRTLNAVSAADWPMLEIVLPLAISFFTFQQIAYLADSAEGLIAEHDFVDYCLFVTFFPQLIAGPIVHHGEVFSQFRRRLGRVETRALAAGLLFFTVGLFKKVVIADRLGPRADRLFDAVADGSAPDAVSAWAGTLAYSGQIYFDFSGYSDIAIGLALMVGIALPLNFDAPYQATSIIDFWRRWHMTLSRFLRDYLYIPLGGNRHGRVARYRNVMITMLLGGLWHGAAWQFAIWGGLHGLYLCANHGWRHLRRGGAGGVAGREAGRALTLLAVVVAWVFFRARDLGDAATVLEAMAGLGGGERLVGLGDLLVSALALATCVLVPASHRLVARLGSDAVHPALPRGHPPLAAAVVAGLLFAFIVSDLARESAFLYFQF